MGGQEFLIQLLGGIALLLWATRLMQSGIVRAWGSGVRRTLATATSSSIKAGATGLGLAMALQSSTAVALLAVSFIERGLLTLQPGLALMLGADVGSTLVVQLISFDMSRLIPVLLITGVSAFMLARQPVLRQCGRATVGLALLLVSLDLIGVASQPLKQSEGLQVIFRGLAEEPILSVLFGAALTWLFHSSVAAIVLFMTLATSGALTTELGFTLILGANIGSGLICFGLTYNKEPSARRMPLGNLLFRAVGAVVLLPFLSWIGPIFLATDATPARQLANFHSGFNVVLAVVFLPLTYWIASFLIKMLPDPSQTGNADLSRGVTLDDSLVDRPALAIACARREVIRMADIVETMLVRSLDMFATNDRAEIKSLRKMDDEIDEAYTALKLYLTDISRQRLTHAESAECVSLIAFTTDLEHIGDIIDRNLLDLATKRQKQKLRFSPEGWSELTEMHNRVVDQMRLAMSVFVSQQPELAGQLIEEKARFREHESLAIECHLDRLRGGRIETVETSSIHLDILRDFKRIVSHLTAVGYAYREE